MVAYNFSLLQLLLYYFFYLDDSADDSLTGCWAAAAGRIICDAATCPIAYLCACRPYLTSSFGIELLRLLLGATGSTSRWRAFTATVLRDLSASAS